MSKVLHINDYKRRKNNMGIKLSYQQINSEGLNQSIHALSMQNGFASFQAGYNVARIVRQFKKELEIAREAYNKWSDIYIVKDEAGKPKPATTPNPFTPWELAEGKVEEFTKKMEDFLKVEVEIQSHPIHPNDLGNIKLSPQQILALEPIFDQAAFEQASEPQQTV